MLSLRKSTQNARNQVMNQQRNRLNAMACVFVYMRLDMPIGAWRAANSNARSQ